MICARPSCGHTEVRHKDPLMDGMCGVDHCNCLGFVQLRPGAAPPAVQVAPPTPKLGAQLPVVASSAPAVIPPPPKVVKVKQPRQAKPRCVSTDNGWTCRLDAGHGIDHHSWSRSGTHSWSDPKPRPDSGVIDLTVVPSVSADPPPGVSARGYMALDRGVSLVKQVDPYAKAREKHPDGAKHCPHCDQDKSVEDFHSSKQSWDGLMGWCRTCMNTRPAPPQTLVRACRNRARSRAMSELTRLHPEEFDKLYKRFHKEALEEATELAEAEAAKELYGDGPGEHVRLRPGRRNKEQSVVDRIDVARCPECVRFHDRGHKCDVCGSLPEHREVSKTAWASVQDQLRPEKTG